jgi:hypothetical protein
MRWLLMAGTGRTICLDATTGLECRQVGILDLPGDRRFNIVIDFDNYRDVEGVKFAHDINEERASQESVQSVVTCTERIELNVPMDDSPFAPPVVE